MERIWRHKESDGNVATLNSELYFITTSVTEVSVR